MVFARPDYIKVIKKIQCVLCLRYVHKGCAGPVDHDLYYCTCCLSDSLPFSTITNSDFLNVILGQSYLKIKAASTDLRLDLNFYDSVESKFIDNEGIDADSNHYNYVFNNILDYSDTNDLNRILPMHESINLKSILHVNARSLIANQDALYENLQTLNHKFSILAITELWTTAENENAINIPGYSKIIKSRVGSRGGGVGLFLDTNLEINAKVRDDLSCSDDNIMESLFVQISQNRLAVKDIIVGVIYRPPNTSVSKFSDSLTQILDKINKEDRPCYMLGDYNVDLINSQSESLLNVLFPNGFYPRINRPTRITNTSATLIDNIFINTHSNNIKSGIWLADISDHFPIFITLPYDTVKKTPIEKFVYKRIYSEENMFDFKTQLTTLSWSSVYNSNGPNEKYNSFFEIINKLHNSCFPLEKIRINTRHQNKPWITTAVLKSIQKKNSLYKRYMRTRTSEMLSKYKIYKNKLTTILRLAEKQYYANKLLEMKSNISGTWKTFKQNDLQRCGEKAANRGN